MSVPQYYLYNTGIYWFDDSDVSNLLKYYSLIIIFRIDFDLGIINFTKIQDISHYIAIYLKNALYLIEAPKIIILIIIIFISIVEEKRKFSEI